VNEVTKEPPLGPLQKGLQARIVKEAAESWQMAEIEIAHQNTGVAVRPARADVRGRV
jgi:hypothetical protein